MLGIREHKNHQVRGGLQIDALPFDDIQVAPLPSIAHIPIDSAAEISVRAGDKVLTGQPLTHFSDHAVTSHASISGKIIGIATNIVSIESDNQDTTYSHDNQQFKNDYKAFFRSMGLVGLGGAAFPVDKKLNSLQATTLLVNAAECDPAIYCDEALMQERPKEIIEGIQIAIEASGARQCIIGIEDNKTKSIQQIERNLPNHIQMIRVPPIYPSGAEKTLQRLCTGKTGSLKDNETICFNIATCYSMYQSVKKSKPLISRIVTIVQKNAARNIEVRIGTPLTELQIAHNIKTPYSIICGGRMMGWTINRDYCVEKRTNSILINTEVQKDARPCIRCGACENVCPENLLPQHLFWHASTPDTSKLQDLKLDQCIECGCCDAVCPSHIPLAGLFNEAKLLIHQEKTEQHKAALAKIRYEKHLARQKEKSVRQRKQLDTKTETLKTTSASDDAKKALIAKALQRQKSRQHQKNKNLSESIKKPGQESPR